jgi:hypothetical protein
MGDAGYSPALQGEEAPHVPACVGCDLRTSTTAPGYDRILLLGVGIVPAAMWSHLAFAAL